MKQTPFSNPDVAAIFDTYPDEIRDKMMFLRQLIFDTASEIEEVGELEETLKWGEPSYLTSKSKSGSTIRIHWKENMGKKYAMYFICSTNLVSTFRELYPKDFIYEGNRALFFDVKDEVPIEKLKHCIEMALTYHLKKNILKK